jgi:hypothetical protein
MDGAAPAEAGLDGRVPLATSAPRRRRLSVAIIAAAVVITVAILVGPTLIPALLNQTPARAPGKFDPSAAGTDTAQVAYSANPGDTDHADGAPDPQANPTTPAVATSTSIPATTAVAPTTTPPTPATTSPSRTFDTDGGTVTATCQGALAVLTSWAPKPAYTVKKVDPGPAKFARIMFQLTSNGHPVNVRIACDTGTPTATIT